MRARYSLSPIAALAAVFVSACRLTPAVAPAVPVNYVGFIGVDTVFVEQFVTTRETVRGRVLTRVTPRTSVVDYTYWLRPDRTLSRAEFLLRPADSATVTQRAAYFWEGDSVVVQTGPPGRETVTRRPAGPTHVLNALALEYGIIEHAVRHAPRGAGDSVIVGMLFPPALGNLNPLVVKRVSADSVILHGPHPGTIYVIVDSAGRALKFDGTASALPATVVRVPGLAFDSLALAFAPRPLGTLSVRDTVTANVHGARVAIDYGRPSRRGRVIFGNVVPLDRVWRTGANLATHMTTSRDMVIGGLTVPAGTYTLWTIPSADGWTLIINRQTGQWGTIYDPSRDLGRVPMTVRRLSEPVERMTISIRQRTVGGLLVIAWDDVEASVPFSPR